MQNRPRYLSGAILHNLLTISYKQKTLLLAMQETRHFRFADMQEFFDSPNLDAVVVVEAERQAFPLRRLKVAAGSCRPGIALLFCKTGRISA